MKMSNLRDLVNKDLKKLPSKETAASQKYFKKGDATSKEGSLDNAVIFYDAAVRLDSNNQEARNASFSAHTTIGDRLFSSDNVEDLSAAVEHYKSALNLNPNNTIAKKKLEKTLENKKFQSQVKKGTLDFYWGIPVHLSKQEVVGSAKLLVRDRADSFLNSIGFHWSEHYNKLNEEASKFILSKLKDRKKYYQREFNSTNLGPIDTIITQSLGFCNDKFTAIYYSVGTPSIELRPYEVSSYSVKSLCGDYHEQDVGNILNINETKLRRLETSGKIIRKAKNQVYGKVYFFENFVVPVTSTVRYHVEIPIRFKYGFKGYGLVRDKLALDFDVTVTGNLVYDGNQGELIEQELTGAELIHKTGTFKGYRYVSPGSQFRQDTVMAGCVGVLIIWLPGGCVAMCAGSLEILLGAAIFGVIVGIFVGSIRYLSRDESDIESMHDDWVEKHPYNK